MKTPTTETREAQVMTVDQVKLTPAQQRFGITDPQQVVDMAKEVAQYVQSNALSVRIQKSHYVLMEGWQFAAGLLGLYGRVEDCVDESTREPVTFKWTYEDRNGVEKEYEHTTKEYRYKAKAQFVRWNQLPGGEMQEMVISQAFATCSNDERKKHTFDEYAIASMAQTRALAKAARMTLAFLIKAAGYKPTPAEEMADAEDTKQSVEKKAKVKPVSDKVQKKIDAFDDHKKLVKWASEQTELANNVAFRQAVMKRKTTLLQQIADGK